MHSSERGDAIFVAPPWLKNPHFQTIGASLASRFHLRKKHWEIVELPDGDFLELCFDEEGGKGAWALLIHGLEGSVYSPYITRQMKSLSALGYAPVVMHFRGCGRSFNRLKRSYHSGDSADVGATIAHLQKKDPEREIFAVGYSMGANVLIKWLGETGSMAVKGACAVSAPFDLASCADRMDQGFSKFYQWILIDSLKQKMWHKLGSKCPSFKGVRTFWDFDALITAPFCGFSSVEEYYSLCSCGKFLHGVQVPLLMLQADDDPFYVPESNPLPEELPENATLECSAHGGHVAFVSGLGKYWLDQRIPDFFSSVSQRVKSCVS